MPPPSVGTRSHPFRRRVLRALGCAVGSTFLAGNPPAGADLAETIAADAATAARLQVHAQTRAGLTSVQADVVTVTQVPPQRTVGRVVLRGPEAYYRVAEERNGEERVVQESAVTRTLQQTVNYDIGVATRVDVARLRAEAPAVQVPNNAKDVLDAFGKAAPASVQYHGPVTVDEVTLDRFRILAPSGDGPPGELLVWVHPADGLPRRMELHSPTGRRLLERQFVNVKVNAPIPDEVFTLRIPAEIPQRDVTAEYLPPQR